MNTLRLLLFAVAVLFGSIANAQVTITIPQDPEVAALKATVNDLTKRVHVLSIPMWDKFSYIMTDNTANTTGKQGSYGGAYWCAQYPNYPDPGSLFTSDITYYDAPRVYYQIADYTKDDKWLACAKTAVKAYRDGYLNRAGAPKPGQAAGWIIFPKGLYMDWQKTGDAASKQAIIDLAYNASFADTPSTSWVPGPATIREMSYNLESKMYANDVGQSIDYSFNLKQLRLYWAQMLYMLQHQSAVGMPAPDPVGIGDQYVRPFMVGISAEALIEYYNRTQDPTVLTTIQPVLDLMWAQGYDGNGAMLYTVPQANGLCPWTQDNSDQCDTRKNPSQSVLNMLIAPAYMWVYAQTGDRTWRDRADTLFQGVVQASYQSGALCCPAGKGFNQVFKWWPEYVAWRKD